MLQTWNQSLISIIRKKIYTNFFHNLSTAHWDSQGVRKVNKKKWHKYVECNTFYLSNLFEMIVPYGIPSQKLWVFQRFEWRLTWVLLQDLRIAHALCHKHTHFGIAFMWVMKFSKQCLVIINMQKLVFQLCLHLNPYIDPWTSHSFMRANLK